MSDDDETLEHRESLWWLTVSPTIWLVHLLASYITVALWCAKFGDEHEPMKTVRFAIGAYTVIALAGILGTGLRGLRRHRFGTGAVRHGFDTAADRHRFLGFAMLLLSGLSAVGVIYVGLPALFFGSCR